MKAKAKAKPPKAASDETLVVMRASFDCPVRFTRGALAAANPDLMEILRRREPYRRHRVLFIIDAGLAAAQPGLAEAAQAYVQAHRGSLEAAAPPLIVEGGEAAKNRPELSDWVRARLSAAGMDRQSHAVIIGGGAVLDASGYAAATLRQGVRVTRLPTTVAAQCDGGVSAASAINAFGRQSAVGAFQPPFGVLIDSQALASLAERDKRSGLGVAARAALACDAAFFHWIADHAKALAGFNPGALETLIRWSARLHWQRLGAEDAFDPGRPGPLDFGGWAAQKLETLSGQELRHGEAAALGCALDALMSVPLLGFPAESARAVLETLAALGLDLWDQAFDEVLPGGRLALLDGLAEFRERWGGPPALPLLCTLGQAQVCGTVTEESVRAAVQALRRRLSR